MYEDRRCRRSYDHIRLSADSLQQQPLYLGIICVQMSDDTMRSNQAQISQPCVLMRRTEAHVQPDPPGSTGSILIWTSDRIWFLIRVYCILIKKYVQLRISVTAHLELHSYNRLVVHTACQHVAWHTAHNTPSQECDNDVVYSHEQTSSKEASVD